MKTSEIVAEYIRLRNELADKRKEFKELEASIKEHLNSLELDLLELSNATGVDSFKTEFGTAYKTVQKYVSINNREDLLKYVENKKDYTVFTNHVNKAHILELVEEGVDLDDIGINYVEEQVIRVRK